MVINKSKQSFLDQSDNRALADFMQKASDLLTANGIGLLHTIITQSNERNGAWVDKYIFPGGYAPQLHELTQELWTAKVCYEFVVS